MAKFVFPAVTGFNTSIVPITADMQFTLDKDVSHLDKVDKTSVGQSHAVVGPELQGRLLAANTGTFYSPWDLSHYRTAAILATGAVGLKAGIAHDVDGNALVVGPSAKVKVAAEATIDNHGLEAVLAFEYIKSLLSRMHPAMAASGELNYSYAIDRDTRIKAGIEGSYNKFDVVANDGSNTDQPRAKTVMMNASVAW